MFHRNPFLSGVVSRGVKRYTDTDPNTYVTLTELAGQIQKVSAELEASKATPQTVLNNQ
jgi:hypothetical protein